MCERLLYFGLQGSTAQIITWKTRSSPQVASSAVTAAIENYGRLDALILNAGSIDPITRIANSAAAPIEAWREHFETNFFANVQLLQLTIPHLRERKGEGRIIVCGSGAPDFGIVGWGAYATSKASMHSLVR
jgi:NAD(P)-dependent dehydrogenase (short-subunit alcohol dehydrogenase family)